MATNVDITNLVASMGSTELHDRIGTATEQTIGKQIFPIMTVRRILLRNVQHLIHHIFSQCQLNLSFSNSYT